MRAFPSSQVPKLPRAVWALGFVSMLMDVSSEMIHALLPLYLTFGLGAGALAVGVIEGIAEATAAITKVFSGALSDWLGRRKALTALGYGLAAVTKPVFPLAGSLGWVVAARFVDRIGKGIRGAPRDALIADLTPERMRGAAFGLRQSLDTVGAFVGPLAAIGLMAAFAGDFRAVFWVAVGPAFGALALILFAVAEPPRDLARPKPRVPLAPADLARLPRRFWAVTAVGAAFTLARFSEAFLILRAADLGLAATWVPLVLVAMNLVYASAAYPVGAASDRIGRRGLLFAGLALLIAADLVLALAPGLWGLGLGVALWGLHMGASQGILSALVADTAPVDLRGTAFGVYNLLTGLALLAASVIAGALWQGLGAPATFLAGAGFAALALWGAARLKELRAAPSAGPGLPPQSSSK
ncbi:MFS transporter [Rhodobacter lacus]|uniref:MFS transporter n=1 Tax=Rhodobacter lacus TaxID=1641972 RepID=A0ABW5A934_9RHOB